MLSNFRVRPNRRRDLPARMANNFSAGRGVAITRHKAEVRTHARTLAWLSCALAPMSEVARLRSAEAISIAGVVFLHPRLFARLCEALREVLFREVRYGSERLHGNPRGSARLHGNPRGSATLPDAPRGSAKLHEAPRSSTRLSAKFG